MGRLFQRRLQFKPQQQVKTREDLDFVCTSNFYLLAVLDYVCKLEPNETWHVDP